MPKAVRKAVFPVGGLGTRFLPATKAMPKEMLPVVDKPLIQYAVEEAQAAGIEEFIFVTGRGKAAIEDHFDYSQELHTLLAERGNAKDLKAIESLVLPAGAVSYTRQQEPLGLGHAVWCARHLIGDDPFAVLLADELVLSEVPVLAQAMALYDEVGGCVFALAEVPRAHTYRYGIVDVESDDGRVIGIKGLIEKPPPEEAPSTLSIIGRYILQPEVFDHLGRQTKGVGDEIQLTDSLAALVNSMPFHGLRFEGDRFDCGGRTGYLKANIAFALARDDVQEELRAFMKSCLT
jgi:UTP--glucose-1-phosphate uridylyltransferase